MAKKRSRNDDQGQSNVIISEPNQASLANPSDNGTAPLADKVRLRPVIENVRPRVEDGRFPAKASVGDVVVVEADVFVDGHDLLCCQLAYRPADGSSWTGLDMIPLGNDRWQAGFVVPDIGVYQFTVSADVDRAGTWHRDLLAKSQAGQDVSVDLAVGARMALEAAQRAKGDERRALREYAAGLIPESPTADPAPAGSGPTALPVADPEVLGLLRRHRPPGSAVISEPYAVRVEPERARFGSWYELFPRSASPDPGRPGTLLDVVDRLEYVEGLGADVLYLPPIHPIGVTNRKGRDGAATARPDDPGSPWAIGSVDGGHQSVDPALGTIEDFDRLVQAAADRGIQVALDLAFQCSPDHPWVAEHPGWFRRLPDGSIAFAENPPKRYEDIYPLDFDTEEWRDLWRALLEVVRFWIGHGVSIFRVDNPHTKPFAFWEWLIAAVKEDRADVLFLSEAFTRPKVMQRLAKIGFSQSYTYFTWRTAKWELEAYLTELVHGEAAEYLRPNFWPNTPDILTEQLQEGGTPIFVTRLILAATLAASYGIYGPVFELQEAAARNRGSEEYANSEKYAVRHWQLDDPTSLVDLVARVNTIRRRHPALQRNESLRFHAVDNDQLLVYSKSYGVEERSWLTDAVTRDVKGPDVILTVVNLDPVHTQAGWVVLDYGALGLSPDQPFEVHDLLTGARYAWQGSTNFVELDPAAVPAHIFEVLGSGVAPQGRGAA
jgi:starch synthase (maltosyl-transferring)